MSILFYVCLFFVCGMMASRCVDCLYQPMTTRNIIEMFIHAAEIVALGYLFSVIA